MAELLAQILARTEAALRVPELEAEIQRLEHSNRDLRERNRQLLEPPRGTCNKLRFHYPDEAEEQARRMERDQGLPAGEFEHYECARCPQHPVTGRQYWHVGHADPAERGKGKQKGQFTRHLLPHTMDREQVEAARRRLEAGGAAG